MTKEMDPVITIIIPTFNSAVTIRNALESILCQTFVEFEVLIMDGGSRDDTVSIVEQYAIKDGRTKFSSEPDKGIYDAMNKGITRAAGEWLLFLGSDDTLLDEKVFERIITKLDKRQGDLFYGNVRVFGDNTWAKDGEIYDGEFSIEKLFRKNICHQCIFYSREAFQKFGVYNIEYRLCADWDFNHRCFAKGTTKYIDEVVSTFNAGGESTLKSTDKYTLEDATENLRKYYDISFSDSFFGTYSNVFLKNGMAKFSKKRILMGAQLLFMAFYHSKNKKVLLHSLLSEMRRLT